MTVFDIDFGGGMHTRATMAEIAAVFEVSHQTVSRILLKMGKERDPRGGARGRKPDPRGGARMRHGLLACTGEGQYVATIPGQAP